ncbi:MAG TPA: cbb3-type cytochrome c oxidase subunit I [Capsulimonadaceae bacterium]|nr:cbb3-type cytochrome c oxidase subunit I [Capsulimonadaceae bacterium]
MAVQQIMQMQPPGEVEKIHHKDEACKWLITVALINLVVFGLFGLTTAIKFVFPGLFNGIDWMSWGRIRPVHYEGVTFGWIVPITYGLFCYYVPRLCGVPLHSEKLGKFSAVAISFGVWFASFFILNPMNTTNVWLMTKAKEWEDYNVPANLIIMTGVLTMAYNIFRTIAARRYRQMYVALWYTMGTLLWTSFVYTIGNWPSQQLDQTFHLHVGFAGSNDATVNWFYGHVIVGLVATPGALAIAYYFLPKVLNAPLYSHKLSIIGFWTLGTVYMWVGAHHLIYGPLPYWLQTVAIIFSFLLFIPVYAAVVNFLGTSRGEWHQLRYNIPLKFFIVATINYAIVSTQGSFQALYVVSAYTHFTDHTIGHSHLALYGFVSLFSYGALFYAVPRIWRRPLYSEGMADWTFWLSFIGITVYLVSMTASGFYQGYLWSIPNIPFIETVKDMVPFWHARAGGGALMVAGMILLAFNIYKTATSPAPESTEGGEGTAATAPQPTLPAGQTA